MYFLLFLAFVILGVLLFLSLVLFYHHRRRVKKRRKTRYIPDYESQYYYEEPWNRSRDRYYPRDSSFSPDTGHRSNVNYPPNANVRPDATVRPDADIRSEGNFHRDVKIRSNGKIRPDGNSRQGGDVRQDIQIPKDEPVSGDAYIPVVHVNRKIPGLSKQELIHFIGPGALYNIETLKEPGEIDLKQYSLTPEIKGEIVLTTKTLLIFNAKNTKKIMIDAIGKYHFQDDCVIIRRKDVKKKKDVLKIFNKMSEFKYILSVIE
jgi:hypothetical protein